MKQGLIGLAIVAVSLAGLVLLNSVYVLDQTQQAVITQFGEPIGAPVTKPGLHWKTPFTETVNLFEKRILEWDGYPSEVPTRDKKFIFVDVTGRWRIDNPLKFLQTMHNERNAQSRLDDIVDGITRNFITRYDLVDVVRSTNRITELKPTGEDIMFDQSYDKIEVGREAITREILEAARKILEEYGIELIDLRIKRSNYIQSVQEKVFERMISERKRAAEQLRSEGEGIKAEIEGKREKELLRIQSESFKTSSELRGEADAKATEIYAQSYGKDPAFYAFLSSLERYPAALRGSNLVLSTDNEFLKYLKKKD